jgi:hypothetical protein
MNSQESMEPNLIEFHGITNRWSLCLSLIFALCGCAGTPPAPVNQIIYSAPPTIPRTFDLDITPTTDNKYLIDGKQESLRDIYWMLRESAHSEKPINTILYHKNTQGTTMQYICYLMLVYNQKLMAYYENDGKITPVQVTSTSDMAFNYFYHQCLDPVISQ